MKVLALFGPTAVGKTGVAIALADRLRERGEDPVAVNCDSIQIYRGLELLSGAANGAERARLEHRLLSFLDPSEEFSAGRYAELARAEIDGLLGAGRRPIVVGGTGLYLRAALSELELRPAVPAVLREEVEADLERHGPGQLHAELPADLAASVNANDRKRVARLTELVRAGIEPHGDAEPLWTTELRHPTLLAGLTMDREELAERIGARVEAMAAAGAADEVRAVAESGASRTARAALGFEQLLAGHDASPSADEVEAIKAAHRRYARRQLTWMRRMEGVTLFDRTGLDDGAAAERILGLLGEAKAGSRRGEILVPVSDRNEAIVRAGIDAWNNDDRAALMSQWAEEPWITAPEGWPEAGEFHGRDAVMGQFERLKAAWSDERIEVIAAESAGEKVLIVGRWLGHGESSGLELDMTVWNVYTLIDGKISHISFNLDEESARAEFEAH